MFNVVIGWPRGPQYFHVLKCFLAVLVATDGTVAAAGGAIGRADERVAGEAVTAIASLGPGRPKQAVESCRPTTESGQRRRPRPGV